MKKSLAISLIIFGISTIVMAICAIVKAPNIVTELNSIVMLISVAATIFFTVKVLKNRDE